MSKLPKNWRDLHAYESNYLGSWDLNEDKDTTVTISRCAVEDVSNGKTSDKLLVVYFKQFDKGVVMNRHQSQGRRDGGRQFGPIKMGWCSGVALHSVS